MRTIKITAYSKNTPPEKAWDILTDINKYPQRVKYVKDVKVYGTGLGSEWDDVTTILWIPLRMRHTVNTLKKNEAYGFTIPIGFGGFMDQKYTISQKNKNTIVEGLITFDLKNKFLETVFGSILKSRLKDMLISSFQKTGGEIINN